MTDLVRLVSGATSPFRVLSGSANPATPLLEDTIFDGNQQPLRVKQKGVIHAPYGPGFASGFGAYGGASAPIANPIPDKRHYCLGLGYSTADNIRRTPSQDGSRATVMWITCTLVSYFTNSGIGVATDAANVWGFNNYAYRPVTGNAGCAVCGKLGCFPIVSTIGFTAPDVFVSYLVLHNTIG